MPNHIRNSVKIDGTPEQIEEVFTFLKSKTDDNRLIDFENITPMPKWIYGSSPDVTSISREAEEKYGRKNTSIDWRYDNWGTKWNAYDSMRDDNVLNFLTANGSPVDLIEKVAWLFPEVTLTHTFYDTTNDYVVYTVVFKDTERKESAKLYEYDEKTGKWTEVKEEEE